MRAAPGQVVAGRYRVTGRQAGGGVPALDLATGEPVLLRGLELPELLTAGEPGGFTEAEENGYGERIAERVTAAVKEAPTHHRLLCGVEVAAEGDWLWVAEERPPGADLAGLAEAGPVPPYRVAELAADLAGALRALHEAGFAHGNVTAESVLVCEDGAAMLGGLLLGAAEEAYCAEVGGPVQRRVFGTRAVLVGVRAERWAAQTGPAGDLWALGVLLYRLLTGYPPYPEDDLATLLAAVRDGVPHPADGCGPLRPLVEALLAADPAARPDAAEVQRRLRALLAAAPEPIGAPAASPALLPVLRPAGPLVPRQRSAGRGVGRSRSPRVAPALLGPLLVGGVLAVLVLALAAVVLLAG